MTRLLIRYIGAPIILFFALLIPLVILSILSSPKLGAMFIIAYPVLIFVWWGTAFSRWLYNRYSWETLSYLISNLFWGFGIIGLGLAIGVGTVDSKNTFGVWAVLAGAVGGFIWFTRSVYQLAFKRETKYETIHWVPLESQMPLLKSIRNFRLNSNGSKPSTGLNPFISEKSFSEPMPKQKTSISSIFRNVSFPISSQSEARSVPIPPRATTRNHSSVEVRLSLSTPSGRFIDQAKKYVNTIERQAKPMPFMQYWPTYEAMNSAQRKWYFYWRSQVRQDNYLPADLSYVFLHIYEVIHLIGFDSAKDAFKYLANIWTHYRVQHPKLDGYLIDWLADFIVVYKLPQTPMNWYSHAIKRGGHLTDQNISIEACLSDGNPNLMQMSSDMLELISGYKYTKSKFYQQYNNNGTIDRELRRGLETIDKYLRQKHGKSLFDYYRPPDVQQIKRYPFIGAVYEGRRETINIANVPSWSSVNDLHNAITSILKYSENRLRRQQNYRGTLRGVELEAEWATVLDLAFPVQTGKIQKQPDVSIEDKAAFAVDTPLTIDYSKVEALIGESDAVRDRLQVSEEDEIIVSKTLHVETSEAKTNEPAPLGLNTARPVDTPIHLLTEIEEVAEIIKVNETAISLLRNLQKHSWEMYRTAAEDTLNGAFLNVVLDRINERAVELLGDQLIFIEGDLLIVAEDYRDEIEHLLDNPVVLNNGDDPLIQSQYDALNPEWAEFASHMRPYHWEALNALLLKNDVIMRLDGIARSVHTTADLLIDEINEFALLSIGDIVIEVGKPPSIEEEDLDGIRSLTAWALENTIKV